jgi:hypothetical protein
MNAEQMNQAIRDAMDFSTRGCHRQTHPAPTGRVTRVVPAQLHDRARELFEADSTAQKWTAEETWRETERVMMELIMQDGQPTVTLSNCCCAEADCALRLFFASTLRVGNK